MNEKDAGAYWNENATAWAALCRAGFDTYRNYLNTPAFFEILPAINGLKGIDIGCGEGYNTRLMAEKGAQMTAVDISEIFIEKAIETENGHPLSIEYSVAGATALPFKNEHFNFAVSFMCLMDVPNHEKALQEAYRVLKPGGFFQFSITHPCFNTPHRKNLRTPFGVTYAIEVGKYFEHQNGKLDEWIFSDAPPEMKSRFQKFKTPIFNRTLTEWFTAIINAGFSIEQINEPRPNDEMIKNKPSLQDASVVPYFLHIRCRK